MAILLPDFKVFNNKGVGYKLLYLAFKDFISMKVWVHLRPIGLHQFFNLAI